MNIILSVDNNNCAIVGVKLGKLLILVQTMGFKINPLKLSLRLEPTTIGVASIRLDKMYDSIGYKRSNEVGFGLFKIVWYI